jgi:hypothetical protein
MFYDEWRFESAVEDFGLFELPRLSLLTIERMFDTMWR